SMTSIVLAATIDNGDKIKVEVTDAFGAKADFLLAGTGVKQNYTLSLTGDNIPPGFLTSGLVNIVFVADNANTGVASNIVIETKGLDYLPTVTGTAYNQAALTT